jgi:hypothetical protein
MSNFSLTVESPVVATVSDATVFANGITQNDSGSYGSLVDSCKSYQTLGGMTQTQFNAFILNTDSRRVYISAIQDSLSSIEVKEKLLFAYNSDNLLTGTDRKEKIAFTVNLSAFDTLLNESDILPSEWSDTGKFQLIFKFVVGGDAAKKSYNVGVEWSMTA